MISKPQKLFQEFRRLDSDCCLLSTIAAQWDSNLYFWLYFCFSCTKHPVQFLFFRKYLVVSLTQSKMVKLNSASSIFLRVYSQRVILSVPKYKWPEADFFSVVVALVPFLGRNVGLLTEVYHCTCAMAWKAEVQSAPKDSERSHFWHGSAQIVCRK